MKRWMWMIAAALVLSVFIYYQTLLTVIAAWTLKGYSASNWGSPLQYEQLLVEGNKLVIVNPRLDNEFLITARQATVSFDLNLLDRRLEIEIDIERPRWHFQTAPEFPLATWTGHFSHKEKWVKIFPHFKIKEGSLSWVLESSQPVIRQINFDLEMNQKEGGYVKLYFDPGTSKSNYLFLQTAVSSHGFEVDCSCEAIDGSSAIALVHFLGIDTSPWLIASGTLQGELKACFPKTHRPYLEGVLTAGNLAFIQFDKGLRGEIGQARIELARNPAACEVDDLLPTTIGRLDIIEPSSFICNSSNQKWRIDQIRGKILVNEEETAWIDFEAQDGEMNEPSKWKLQGKANLNANRSPSFDLTLTSSSPGRSDGKLQLALNEVDGGFKRAKVQCENFSCNDCSFLQTILAPYWTVLDQFTLEDGEFNAWIEADVTPQGIGEFQIKHFDAFNVCAFFKAWKMACDFGNVRGYGKADLGRKDFWDSVNCGLHLEEGEIWFEELAPPLPMTDLQAHLFIRQGYVEHSLVTLQIAGLKGKMDIEWGNRKQLLTFKLDGLFEDIAYLFPDTLEEGFRSHFYRNRLMVLANLKRHRGEIELDGTLHVQRSDADLMDFIHFGCSFKQIQEGSEFKTVPVGWFHAQKLPLNKFISPFLFRGKSLHLSGEAEFRGSFDDRLLIVKYDTDDLKIENDNLLIEIPRAERPVPGQLMGSHTIDLQSHAYEGSLVIQEGSYLEKNTGLLFRGIEGKAFFQEGTICISPIETECEGIYFAGELELDHSDPAPGVFDVKINCPMLSGKVSQIQHLLAHIDPASLLHKIPLQGDVSAKNEGLKLKFSFREPIEKLLCPEKSMILRPVASGSHAATVHSTRSTPGGLAEENERKWTQKDDFNGQMSYSIGSLPKDFRLDADFQGKMTDGGLSFEDAEIALRGIYLDLEYHHEGRFLEFRDIQGALLLGKPRRMEEFAFSGSHMRFYPVDHPNPDIDFDVSVKDQQDEWIRLTGYTQEEKGKGKKLYLDEKLSHFSCIYPKVWQCCLKDSSTIDRFEFSSEFKLGELLQDLARFRRTGLFFLSPAVIDKISEFIPVDGDGLLDLSYEPAPGWTFRMQGSRIKQGDSPDHFSFLKGRKLGKKWLIDQLQWDDWSLYAELHQALDRWEIPFLGMKGGDALLLGLKGDLWNEEALLKAQLNFCEVDLSKLDFFASMRPFMAKWSPKGNLHATGELEWSLLAKTPSEGCKVVLEAEVANFHIRDFPIAIGNRFRMSVQPYHRLLLENIEIEFSPQSGHSYFYVKEFDYQTALDSIQAVKANFQIPHDQLSVLGEELYHHFSDFFGSSFKERFVEAKQQDHLKGTLAIEQTLPNQPRIRLELEDGLYTYKGRQYDLKQLKFLVEENRLEFSAMTQQERYPFHVIGHSQWPLCDRGELKLIGLNETTPLTIQWENHLQKGCILHSLKGKFGGCSLNLNREEGVKENNDWTALQGNVSIDFQPLSLLLAPSILDNIQKLKLNAECLFAGSVWFNLENGMSLVDSVSFNGILSSREFAIKGCQMQSLKADVQYIPGRLDLQNLTIQDPAGSLKLPGCVVSLDRTQDNWRFFLPYLIVKNLKLNLLKKAEAKVQENYKFRSLVFKKIEFQNLEGELDHISSWQGRGNLYFVNPSRKNPFHPLIAIPAEIILRLGLNPQVLNPVTGSIYFVLQGDRLYLTRFKDVYSEGRGSKFHLAEGVDPSWVDVDGNLSVNVRMKQYNLIFKIAELFTVSIQGNIAKPKYVLQKQPKRGARVKE